MAKQIIYSEEGRFKFKAGVDKLANAVKVTLGPKGKTVILSKKIWFSYYNRRWSNYSKRNRIRRSL